MREALARSQAERRQGRLGSNTMGKRLRAAQEEQRKTCDKDQGGWVL